MDELRSPRALKEDKTAVWAGVMIESVRLAAFRRLLVALNLQSTPDLLAGSEADSCVNLADEDGCRLGQNPHSTGIGFEDDGPAKTMNEQY